MTMHNLLPLPAGLASLLAVALPASAFANGPPIQSETAFTTGLNGAAVRTFTKVVQSSGSPGDALAIVTPVVVPYELVDNKLVLGLGLPLVHKALDTADGASRGAGFGVGDLNVFGKFNLFQHDEHQGTFRIAGKLSLTLPTGRDDASDDMGPLPPPLQRGTGSVNPSVMLIVTRLWRRFGVNADLGFTAFPEANGIDRGDILRYDVAASFRLLPWVFDTYPDHQVNLMLELNGTWAEKTRMEGKRVDASGGHLLLASPGLQYMYSTIIVEASVQIPVPGATSLNGDQLEPDWSAMGGVRWLLY